MSLLFFHFISSFFLSYCGLTVSASSAGDAAGRLVDAPVGRQAITLNDRALILGFEECPLEIPMGRLEGHTKIQPSVCDRTKEKAPSVHRRTQTTSGHTTTLLSQYGRFLNPVPEDSPPENGHNTRGLRARMTSPRSPSL